LWSSGLYLWSGQKLLSSTLCIFEPFVFTYIPMSLMIPLVMNDRYWMNFRSMYRYLCIYKCKYDIGDVNNEFEVFEH
jgi:hypothetical protein